MVLEEPDLSKIGSEQKSNELKRFVDLVLRFGLCREETYQLGSFLMDLIGKVGFEIKKKLCWHPQLIDDAGKQLIIRLATDLAPKFSTFKLAASSELCILNRNLISQINAGDLKTIHYCEMTQILAQWPGTNCFIDYDVGSMVPFPEL